MIEFAYGLGTMYCLGVLLLLNMLEAGDPDRPNSVLWFALTWPFLAVFSTLEAIYYGVVGGND